MWGCAGIGLLIGGLIGHRLGERLSFDGYKRTVVVCYVVHGGAYVLFSQMRNFHAALVFIALSRAAVAVSSVLNYSQLLRHVANEFRGRVFATMESMVWSTMMISMMLAGIASQYSIRARSARLRACSVRPRPFSGAGRIGQAGCPSRLKRA